MQGFVKLHRQFLKWEWYDDAKVKAVFIHCLLRANHKKNKWRGVEIDRGQFVSSIRKIATETGLSVQETRTTLDKLERTGEITRQATHRHTLVNVVNYSLYQGGVSDSNTVNNTLSTQCQHSINTVSTTNKKEKKLKNEKKEEKDTETPPRKPKVENTPEYQSFLAWFMKNYRGKKTKVVRDRTLPKVFQKHETSELKRAVERYMKEKQGKDKEFIMHEGTWWNGRYVDYLDDNHEPLEGDKRERDKKRNQKFDEIIASND